uniref:Pre-rRNA-processing protein TSR2 homolog n=1 Tax=Plectus sambesii TaxID=2011161 RepID=A0A914W1R5_9BILA
MASTSNSVLTFPAVITRLLRAWTAYQYALQAQMGGSATSEKAAWFESVLAELFTNNRNLQVDEVIDWIDELLYNEFDLIVEDGSIDWLADALIKCFGWLSNARYDQVDALLARLPSDSAVAAATAQSTTAVDDAAESDSAGDDEDSMPGSGRVPVVARSNATAASSNGEALGAQSLNNGDEAMDESKSPDSDGWTTVSKKGKRK